MAAGDTSSQDDWKSVRRQKRHRVISSSDEAESLTGARSSTRLVVRDVQLLLYLLSAGMVGLCMACFDELTLGICSPLCDKGMILMACPLATT